MKVQQGNLHVTREVDDLESAQLDGELVECPTCYALVFKVRLSDHEDSH